MKIPPPTPEELVSAEKIKEYFETLAKTFDGRDYNVDSALDHGSNALAMASGIGARWASAMEKTMDSFILDSVKLLSPQKLTYEGLEAVSEAYELWKQVRQDFGRIVKNAMGAVPVSKARAHRVMDSAFRCFDENPENLEAKHYRDLLQQGAKILDLPPLGEEIKLSALSSAATKSVAPSKNTP